MIIVPNATVDIFERITPEGTTFNRLERRVPVQVQSFDLVDRNDDRVLASTSARMRIEDGYKITYHSVVMFGGDENSLRYSPIVDGTTFVVSRLTPVVTSTGVHDGFEAELELDESFMAALAEFRA